MPVDRNAIAALATLVDAGKLGWDDKVVDRLPGFQMYDPWVTREMTVDKSPACSILHGQREGGRMVSRVRGERVASNPR